MKCARHLWLRQPCQKEMLVQSVCNILILSLHPMINLCSEYVVYNVQCPSYS